MPAKTINNQSKIDFVKAIMRQKVAQTRLADTPACQVLAGQVRLSYATLLKVLKGEFTTRTVNRMIQAGWFTRIEYRRAQQGYRPDGDSQQNQQSYQNQTRQSNDQAQQRARERDAFRRGFRQGRTEGYNEGLQVGRNRVNSGDRAYSRGYVDGLRDGENRAQSRSNPSGNNGGVPLQRIESLLSLNASRGAAQGEITAARKAVGKTLAKWLKEKFGQDLDIQVS